MDGPRPSRKAAHDGEGRERCGLEEITEELAAAVDNAEDELKTLFGMFVELMYVTPKVAALYVPSSRPPPTLLFLVGPSD